MAVPKIKKTTMQVLGLFMREIMTLSVFILQKCFLVSASSPYSILGHEKFCHGPKNPRLLVSGHGEIFVLERLRVLFPNEVELTASR